MADKIEGAVGVVPEAPGESLATIIDAGEQRHLVDLGAELGLRRVNRRGQVAQRLEARHRPFAEQVPAVGQFPDQLIEGDGLPLARIARADALQRRQYAKR